MSVRATRATVSRESYHWVAPVQVADTATLQVVTVTVPVTIPPMSTVAAVLLGLALAAGQSAPPSAAPLRARLSPVPIDVAMAETIAGLGDATATLTGTTLRVEGTYRGLRSPATSVRVFESPRPGLRGPLVGEFVSGKGTAGAFKGTVALTREQAAAFTKGLLYVQLQSEKAPDGNLWGWLTPGKGRR